MSCKVIKPESHKVLRQHLPHLKQSLFKAGLSAAVPLLRGVRGVLIAKHYKPQSTLRNSKTQGLYTL